MALTARSIITLNNAKDYLNITTGATDKDTLLETWIDWISGKFEAEIDNVIQVQTKTLILNGSGEPYQYVPFYPIAEIYGDDEATKLSNIQYRDTVSVGWVDLLDDIDLAYINPFEVDRLELLDDETFPEGLRNIRLKYNAGYSTIPGDILIVVTEAVAMMWAESKQGQGLLGLTTASSNLGVNASVSLGSMDFGPRWREIVRRYQRPIHTVEFYR